MTRRMKAATPLLTAALIAFAALRPAPLLAQSFGEQVGQQMQDAVLITKVAAKVQYHRDLLLEKVEITANNGVVTLSGRVSTQRGIDLAGKLASQVGGVKQVVNQLVIGRREPDHAVITPP